MGYNLPINGVYWGYNPLTNLLPTSWDIQVSYLSLNWLVSRQDFWLPSTEGPVIQVLKLRKGTFESMIF